jgi:hypothetical protein
MAVLYQRDAGVALRRNLLERNPPFGSVFVDMLSLDQVALQFRLVGAAT